jgi:hypothetical protein
MGGRKPRKKVEQRTVRTKRLDDDDEEQWDELLSEAAAEVEKEVAAKKRRGSGGAMHPAGCRLTLQNVLAKAEVVPGSGITSWR